MPDLRAVPSFRLFQRRQMALNECYLYVSLFPKARWRRIWRRPCYFCFNMTLLNGLLVRRPTDPSRGPLDGYWLLPPRPSPNAIRPCRYVAVFVWTLATIDGWNGDAEKDAPMPRTLLHFLFLFNDWGGIRSGGVLWCAVRNSKLCVGFVQLPQPCMEYFCAGVSCEDI